MKTYLAANEYGDDRTRAKTETQGPALNEKPQYCWLNSDKMGGSDENCMAIKMAERSKERHGNPNSENNSGETAIATAQENGKLKQAK